MANIHVMFLATEGNIIHFICQSLTLLVDHLAQYSEFIRAFSYKTIKL